MSSPERIIYLDNAATTYPKPEQVYQSADTFYRLYGGNAGRGANPLARKAAELISETRAQLSEWLGVSSPEQVVFTPSATIALNLAILGIKLRPGDIAYVTPFEHNSVLRPLEYLRQTRGIHIQEIPFDHRTLDCRIDELASEFHANPPTLVCTTQASNVCGVLPPVLDIARLAKESNPDAIIVVDGAQVAGLYTMPLCDGKIDAYIFSGHKSLYGPYGVAGLVFASEWRPTCLLYGGTGTFSESVQMPSNLPSAYEVGSQNIYAIAGLRAALDWLQMEGRDNIVRQTQSIALQLRDAVNGIPNLTLYMPDRIEVWTGILSFTAAGISPQAIEMSLGAQNIAVRAGLHCAPWAHRWLGTLDTGGTVRVSVGVHNSADQIHLFSSVLSHLVMNNR